MSDTLSPPLPIFKEPFRVGHSHRTVVLAGFRSLLSEEAH